MIDVVESIWQDVELCVYTCQRTNLAIKTILEET